MKKKYPILILFFLCLLALNACSKSNASVDEGTKAIKEVLTSTSKSIENKYDIKCIGNTYAAMYEVEKLGLRFFHYDKMNIEDGRAVILDIAKTLVENVKNNQAIQPYLMKNGFEYENLDLAIWVKPENKSCFAPEIGLISLFNNKIKYEVYDKEAYETRGIPKTEIVFSETYSEALIALENQHSQEVI